MANKNHFNLTLDTTKPTGSIECKVRYTNKVEDLAVDYNDDAAYMKVWFDTASDPKSAPADLGWQALAHNLQTAFADDETYFYHVQFVDSIGNESEIYSTDFITFDTVVPTINYFRIKDLDSDSETLTNARTIKYELLIGDASVSGIKSATFSGDCATVTLEIPGAAADLEGELVLTEGDATKKVILTVEDYAGNKLVVEKSITLDMTLDAAIIQAYRNEKDAANLITTYSNTNVIFVELAGVDTGVNGYKIWTAAEGEPQEFNKDGAYSKTIEFPAGLSDQTIYAKVIDAAGNVKESVAKVINIDTIQPTGTVSTDVAQFSNIERYNKVVITANVADNMPVELADKYVTVNGNKVAADWNENKAVIEITSAQANKEGANVIKVYAQDVAMKEANVAAIEVATCSVELDTKAPTASFGTPNAWYTAQGDVKLAITHADGTGVGVDKLFVWVDTNATAANVPTGVAATAALNSGAVYTPDYTALAQGKNYIHALVVDKVGNSLMINSAEFGYDSVKPEKPVIKFDKTIYPSASATVTITASDATSGLNKMWVDGDIVSASKTPAEGEAFATTKSVTLTEGDGKKVIKVKVMDKAGNISEYSDNAETVLDTTAPAATIALFKRGTEIALGNFSAVAEFDAHIEGVDDAGLEGQAQYYQVYGDGIGVAYNENNFVELVYNEGKAYKVVELTATANAAEATSGELKEVYVIVKDDAGHVSAPVKASFTYDPTAAEIEVKNVSDNIISCVHAFRRTSVSTVSEKYCDEVTFSFVPDSNIVAYKVCAFASQELAAAANDPEQLFPIGTDKQGNIVTGFYAGRTHSIVPVQECFIQDPATLWQRLSELSLR